MHHGSILIVLLNMKLVLSAREAAAELGIGLPTLYAYVSRGMLRSEPEPGSRRKLYSAADIRALKARHADGGTTSRQDTGLATIESALTLIHEGRLYYRGVEIEALARSARLESVASLLWDCGTEDPFAEAQEFQPVLPESLDGPAMTRLLIGLAAASDRDLAAHARSPDALARTGARILRQAVASAVGVETAGEPVHLALAKGWGRPEAAETVRAALVVTADHELAASTYAVRVATSTGASPWRAVSAGLSCLDGPRHGGMAERVAHMLDSIASPEVAEAVMAARLKRGEAIPGFGHPLYPEIDPRARILLAIAGSDREGRHNAVVAAARRLIGRAPNVDFGLVAASRAARLPAEAPLVLFAIGRMVGWIAHIIEQSRSERLIRPRTRYIGPLPG